MEAGSVRKQLSDTRTERFKLSLLLLLSFLMSAQCGTRLYRARTKRPVFAPTYALRVEFASLACYYISPVYLTFMVSRNADTIIPAISSDSI